MITFADVEKARKRIGDSVFLSPCAYSETLTRMTGVRCWLKLENLQMTGSFKERGAVNRLLELDADERARGVICASAGNHAQGISYHATRLGIDATIVMPENTPLIKIQSTKGYGGRVILHGTSFDEACDEAWRVQRAENRTFVHAFDDDLIIAGQGTVGLELLEQNPYLEAIVVPIGGGGLAAGIAVAIKETNPKIEVYGVETASIPSMKEAVKAGHIVAVPPARTIAEGIAVRKAGERTLDIVQKYIDDIVLVDEEEIAEAILLLLEREKTVAEGAGAAPLAALVHKRLPLAGKKTAMVISGGNIDVNVIARIIDRGLVKSGRLVRLSVTVPDVAGSLAGLTRLVADSKANVLDIVHERAFGRSGMGETTIELVLETRGRDHSAELRGALGDAGYDVTDG